METDASRRKFGRIQITGNFLLEDSEMIKTNIRAFENTKDMEGAVRCFNEGFDHILWPFIKHAKPSLQEDLVKFFYKMSTDCFVAEVDGEICSIIFGAAPLR